MASESRRPLRSAEARKDGIAADTERKIGVAVAEWYDSGEFDLHARVRAIVRQALTDYEAVLKAAGGQGDRLDDDRD